MKKLITLAAILLPIIALAKVDSRIQTTFMDSKYESATIYNPNTIDQVRQQASQNENLTEALRDTNTSSKSVIKTAAALDYYQGNSCEQARQNYLRCRAMGYDFCYYRCSR